ncbi:MAG: aldo/keto reductase [Candidatus Micrarchaeota archaeon]
MDISTKIKLNNGIQMPMLGFGTWQLKQGKETEQAVLWALEAGYVSIDTASYYANEENVGKAIRKSDIPREEIFVTTKIWNDEHADPEQAFNDSLERLGLDYIDLYLIHWPVKERLETWKVFEKLYKQGKCKSIGVSNFTIKHLNELLAESKTVPALNQVEFNSFLYQKELLEFCKSKNIVLEAYCPLSRAKRLDDPKIVSIAKNHSKTSAQVLLRWALQHDVVVIPKSKHKERIIENADIFGFNLSAEEMIVLDGLNENLRVTWDPTNAP